MEECKHSCSLFAQYWRNFAEVFVQDGQRLLDQPGPIPASWWATYDCSVVMDVHEEITLQTILHHTSFPHPTPTAANNMTFEDISSAASFNDWQDLFQGGLDIFIKRGHVTKAARIIYQDILDLASLTRDLEDEALLSLKKLIENVRDFYFDCGDGDPEDEDDEDDPEAWAISDSFLRLEKALRDGQDFEAVPLAEVKEDLRRLLSAWD